MGQLPILKDGVVVNVIEIDNETEIVTKDEHKRRAAEEMAAYETSLAEWREVIRGRQNEAHEALTKLQMAKMTLEAKKTTAAEEKTDAGAALALRQILSMEEEVKRHEKAVLDIEARPLPVKPKLVRRKRWFHPQGLEVGPAGGNIGDLWDGKTYSRPLKVEESSSKAEQPVV